MIHKTRGIVFRFTKFRETSIIVTIFTEQFGLQSYIVNGVRSKSATQKIALFQPLTLLNLVVYHRENANIERIKEVHCLHPYQHLNSDLRKCTIAIFLAELINKTIKHESHTAPVFDFLFSSMIALDALHENIENFHLVFMIRLARFLGFGVQNVNEIVGGQITSEAIEDKITRLIESTYTHSVTLSQPERREILDLLIRFYSDHMEGMGELRSVPVLKEVLG